MIGARIKLHRQRLGLSQADLAERAGVSRQLVGALEAGRHLPRVDSALGLANALGVDVGELFGSEGHPIGVVSGRPPDEGSVVRLGRVGDQLVFSQARVETLGWDSADGVVEHGRVRRLTSVAPGPVMVGCEPALELLERNLREAGKGATAVGCSTRMAVAALGAGRAHAAVVHGARDDFPATSEDAQRFRLCSWRVGLAAPSDAASGWAEEALEGQAPVVQRESGASVQAAFERAAGPGVDGPRVGGHVEAVRVGLARGTAAVTIEPAAVALGAQFHPLETHEAELWLSRLSIGDPSTEALLNEINTSRFRLRLHGVGGYDLTGIGSRAA